MNWLHYLLEANIYLGVFYVAYCLFLNKETHYLLNRFYLVLSSIVSFILPVLQLGILLPPLPEPPTASYFVAQQVTHVAAPIAVPVQVTAPAFTLQDGLWYLYLAGAFVCAVLLAIKLFSLFKLIRTNKVVIHDNYRVVYLKDTNTAFSFFNYLFIGTAANNERTILRHELVHIRQKHSADILFLEFLKIINWFNPLVYLLQNSLKTQHEYIADEQTVINEADATSYSSFLVNNAYGLSGPAITHSFYNLNLLKNRIIMLHQQRSGNLARLKYLVAVPIGAALLCASTLAFSKTYGWIDLAPVHIAQQPKRIAPPPPIPPKQNADDYYYGWANFIEPTDDLKKMGLSLQKEGYKIKSRKIGSNQLYISIETLPRLGQHRSANATFNIDELKKLNHVIAIGGGSFGGEEKVFVRIVPKSDMKNPSTMFMLDSITWRNNKATPPKPKNDQVRFPPPIVAPNVPADFKPEKSYVNEKGFKVEEGPFTMGNKTYYVAIISNTTTGKKSTYFKGFNTNKVKAELEDLGYAFPDVKVSSFLSSPPPERAKPAKTDQVKFPPPIVKPDKSAPKTKTDQVKFPPPVVRPDRSAPPKMAKPKNEVVEFPPPVVRPDKSAPKTKIDQVKFPPPVVRPDTSNKHTFTKPNPFNSEFLKFIGDHVKYPTEARQKGTMGYVIVEIKIDDYMITNSRIVNGIGHGCDEEVLRVLNTYKNKTKVKSGTYTVSVAFMLGDLDNPIANPPMPKIAGETSGHVVIVGYGTKK